MKLHDFAMAPNAQRVRVYLAEKNIEIPIETLNVRKDEQFVEPFTSMNPFHCVPFLELDNGTVISESMSICRYLEELHPEPALFGTTAEERAVIDMWLRRFELDALLPMQHALRNHIPMFVGKVIPGTRMDIPQSPEVVNRGQQMMEVFLDRVEPHMARNEFVAGTKFTVADITGYFALRTTTLIEMDISETWPAVATWFAKISARPAFQL